MPRKIMVQTSENSTLLVETLADDEAQLQELIKEHPELLPIEEFGMSGPLMVIGRETTLPSGAVDLVALARGGEFLVIEFKTGPQNTDFRHALSQLVDYGSDIWRMSYEDFEQTVAARYFASSRCQDERLRAVSSLAKATKIVWPDLSEEEESLLRDKLVQQLTSGSFHYLLVAQRFTRTIEHTIDYLNAVTKEGRFYAVELVRFAADGLSAFESRTVLKPSSLTSQGTSSRITEEQLLEEVTDEPYREALSQLFEVLRGLGFISQPGSVGISIRVPTSDGPEPLTIAWIFPPGRPGWMGLTNLTLGFDPASAKQRKSVESPLSSYIADIERIEDFERVTKGSLWAFHFSPELVIRHQDEIGEVFAELIRRVNEAG